MIKNILWRDLLFQMISVTFGVLLALWVNQWQESKKELADLNQALQGLANEINNNNRFLTERIHYYQKVIDEIDSISNLRSDVERIHISSYKGLNPPYLRRSSFDLSMSTGVLRQVSYDKSERLAQVYAYQDFFLKVVDVLINQFISSAYHEKTKMKEVRNIFSEWIGMGNELLSVQAEILEQLPLPKDIGTSR